MNPKIANHTINYDDAFKNDKKRVRFASLDLKKLSKAEVRKHLFIRLNYQSQNRYNNNLWAKIVRNIMNGVYD